MASELRSFEPSTAVGADARLSEAHHRIANNLALVAGYARLQATSLSRRQTKISAEEVAIALEEISARIETIGRLHRLLSRDPSQPVVDIGAYLGETCRALADSMTFGADMDIIFHCTETCVGAPDQAGPVALIVTELVTNALKYAHPTGLAGRVDVSCRSRRDGAILVMVRDDGVGLPVGFDPAANGSLGMRVVRSLALQLRGELEFASTDLGLTVRLAVPGPMAPMGK